MKPFAAAQEAKVAAVRDIVQSAPPNGHPNPDQGSRSHHGGRLRRRCARPPQSPLRPKGTQPPTALGPMTNSRPTGAKGLPYRNLMLRSPTKTEIYNSKSNSSNFKPGSNPPDKKVVILFEGRDAAGKGGTIRRLHGTLEPTRRSRRRPRETERCGTRTMVLPTLRQPPPTAGEIVMFDRSWYNRAGVERVMNFCSDLEYNEFMRQAPEFERNLVRRAPT